MAIHNQKKGRSGDELSREVAASWVRLYREAEMQDDGKIWAKIPINGCIESIPYVDASDPQPLLKILDNFSKTGFFGSDENEDFRFLGLIQLRYEYDRLTKTVTREAAIDVLARKWSTSAKSIERRLTEINAKLPKS